MWKRKSIPAVTETQVAEDPDEAPEPAPARSIREYHITSASAWSRLFKVKEQPSQNVIYTLILGSSSEEWGLVLAVGGQKDYINAPVAAAAKVSLFRTITHLALGDPRTQLTANQQVELKLDSKWKHNKYAVSLPLPEGKVFEMQWKGTNEVKGFMKKMDRGMHHKLVEKSTNKLLARYVHNPWSMDIAGTVEICADIPSYTSQHWDLFVLVSALAVAEKTVKITKMAVHMDDDPTVLVEAVAGGSMSTAQTVPVQSPSTVDTSTLYQTQP